MHLSTVKSNGLIQEDKPVSKIIPFNKRSSTSNKKEDPKGNLLLAVLCLVLMIIALTPFFLVSIVAYWVIPAHAKSRAKAWFDEIFNEGYKILNQIEKGHEEDGY